jgi:actin-related protein
MVMVLPVKFTQSETERLIDLIFTECPVSNLLLVNPWIAVLCSTSRHTGVVVYIEETTTCIASIVAFKVEEHSIVHIPFGSKDFSDTSSKSETQRHHDLVHEVREAINSDPCNIIVPFFPSFVPLSLFLAIELL